MDKERKRMAPFQIPKESVDFDKINNVLVAINYNLVNIHLFKFNNRTTVRNMLQVNNKDIRAT